MLLWKNEISLTNISIFHYHFIGCSLERRSDLPNKNKAHVSTKPLSDYSLDIWVLKSSNIRLSNNKYALKSTVYVKWTRALGKNSPRHWWVGEPFYIWIFIEKYEIRFLPYDNGTHFDKFKNRPSLSVLVLAWFLCR